MAELKIDSTKIGAAAAAIVVALLALGVYGKVQGLETRVTELNVAVDQLADVQTQLDEVNAELGTVRANLRSIAQARDDILREICNILGREPARCGVT